MYSILNKNGSVTGYIVGDYYLTIEQARMFFNGYVAVTPKYGERHGSSVTSSITTETLRAKSINASNYFDFVSKCIDDKADLMDIVFVPCDPKELAWDTDNEIWRLTKCHLYQCMQGVRFLGYLLTDLPIYTNKSVMVVMLEVLPKRKGLGSLIVNKLKDSGIHLSGLSTVEAVPFWEKHGAVFSDCNRFKI